MYTNHIKNFLNLKGAYIKKVLQADSFIRIFIQPPSEQTCPCCGAKTKRIHDYHLQEVQDIPLQGKQVSWSFVNDSFLPNCHRKIRRLASYIVPLFRQTFSVKQIAELTGVSVQTVCRFLDQLSYVRLAPASTFL